MTTHTDLAAQEQAAFEKWARPITATAMENGRYVEVMTSLAWEAWQARAALKSQPDAAQGVPEGWRLVPIEPTEDMFVDGMEADCCGRPSIDDDTHVRSIWNAMLAATPKPQEQAAQVVAVPGGDASQQDTKRLDWIESCATRRKIEIARSILGTGFEIGEWSSLRVTVKSGTMRDVIDAAMTGEIK